MKQLLLITSGTLLFSVIPSLAGVSTKDDLELLTASGPFAMWQTSDWISADTSILSLGVEEQSGYEFSLSNGFFTHVDYCDLPIQCLLFWKHDKYFVNVFSESEVIFSILYRDLYNNPASAGYPKVTFWPQGTQDYTTLSLPYLDARDGGAYYSKNISLPAGAYWYRYSAKNDHLPDEYALEISSFVVTKRPGLCDNGGNVTETAVVSNAKVVLQWKPPEGAGQDLTYKLYLGTDPDALSLAYQGILPRYEVSSLDYGKQYYWQIEAQDRYGVSSKTPVYHFKTIAMTSKSYNYPNPFNPALQQKTNILFNMTDPGSAELRIYSEMGDLCWQRSFDNLAKGANEITYDGKDDLGQTLYNGTYVCFIKKIYANNEEKESCRLMIIK